MRTLFWMALLAFAVAQDEFSTGAINSTMMLNSTNTTVPTMAPTNGYPLLAEGECYSDLDYLWNANNLRNPFEEVTFVICPNTVYEIGFIGPMGGDRFVGGSPPLELRQNSRIMCGFDGKSSNNCVLRGGQFQVFANTISYGGEDKVNIQIQGMTFEDGRVGGIVLVAAGDVTFIDCVVQKQVNTGPVLMLYNPSGLERRLEALGNLQHKRLRLAAEIDYYAELIENGDMHKPQRRLQDSVDFLRMGITFRDCTFTANKDGFNPMATTFGVITSQNPYHDLVIENCVFANNSFGKSDEVSLGYGILVTDKLSTLNISDTCFVDNEFVGRGAINIGYEESLISTNNVSGTTGDDDLECQYVSIGDGRTNRCIEYDSIHCSGSRARARAGLVAIFVTLVFVL